MNIGVLTSSRADFGIYLPLLKKMKKDDVINLQIIAFGTHCSSYHGNTITEIEESGFDNIDIINSLLVNDDPESIATAYGLTVIKFADYWSNHKYDLVFCLGDRFEMSAAVQAGIPYEIKYAHLHGGETTIGAIDNIYRHQITQASYLHFTSTSEYAHRVSQLIGSEDHIYNVGALSLDGIDQIHIMDESLFRKKYSIPEESFILTTFHPETVESKRNKAYAEEMKQALDSLAEDYYIVITMPNADTLGTLYRQKIHELKIDTPNAITVIENFGKQAYFSAMEHAALLLGNSSSGIVEAASFDKYVVNVGERQKGRTQSKNIINCSFQKDDILDTVKKVVQLGHYKGDNIYYQENSSKKILGVIKEVV